MMAFNNNGGLSFLSGIVRSTARKIPEKFSKTHLKRPPQVTSPSEKFQKNFQNTYRFSIKNIAPLVLNSSFTSLLLVLRHRQ